MIAPEYIYSDTQIEVLILECVSNKSGSYKARNALEEREQKEGPEKPWFHKTLPKTNNESLVRDK